MAWIRASQGGGGPTPTRITPGNSNPPYLVEDEVYEMNGNGRAIGSLTSITPSNDSPVFLNPIDIYKPDVSGYAVGSVTPITPSNSTPAPLSTSYVYKPSESGHAIKSYQSITPSSSGAAFNAGFVKMSAGGYACTSQPGGGGTYSSKVTVSSSMSVNFTIAKNSSSIIDLNNWASLSGTGWKLLELMMRVRWGNNYYVKIYVDNANRILSQYQLSSNALTNWTFTSHFEYNGGTTLKAVNADSSNAMQLSVESALFVKE